jgi:hypothetical protein
MFCKMAMQMLISRREETFLRKDQIKILSVSNVIFFKFAIKLIFKITLRRRH